MLEGIIIESSIILTSKITSKIISRHTMIKVLVKSAKDTLKIVLSYEELEKKISSKLLA